MKLNRGAEAIPIIDDCVRRAAGKAVDEQLIPQMMEIRLHHFQTTKDAHGCRETAEIWEKLNRADATSLYNAARFRAVAAAMLRAASASPSEVNPEADRAMAWLEKAVAAGYKNAGQLESDSDLPRCAAC